MLLTNQKGFAHILLILILLAGIGIGVYLTQFTQIFKPKAASGDLVASLTKELISENEKLKQQGLAQPGSAQDQAPGNMASIAYRRKQGLLKLIKENPEEFLKQATLASTAGNFPQSIQQDLEKLVEEKGTILHLHFDDFKNKTAEEKYYLDVRKTAVSKERLDLVLAGGDAHLLTGTQVNVKGVKLDNNLVAGSDVNGVHEIYGTRLNVTSAAGATRVKDIRIAAILFNFKDNPNEKPFTKEEVLNSLLHNKDSVKNFYKEASNGQVTISAEAFGWFTIPKTVQDCATYQWPTEWQEAAFEATKKSGVDLNGFNYLAYFFPANSCHPSAGSAPIGGNWVFITALTGSIISHELGHNLSIHHANTLTCGDKIIGNYLTCKNNEYGDNYDVMGTTYHLFNAPHDVALGFLPGVEVQTVTQNGIYKIAPLKNPGPGIKALKIAKKDTYEDGQNEYYYLEYRQPYGFFDKSFMAGPFDNTVGITRGASIHIWNENPSFQTRLLDATPNPQGPQTEDGQALTDNQTFTDPFNGISVKQLSHDTTGVTVEINFSPGSAALINASPSEVKGGEFVTVNVLNIINPTSTDWVGIYHAGEQDPSKWQDWFYLGSCNKTPGEAVSDKSCQHPAPNDFNTPDGRTTIKFILFSNNSYQELSSSNYINVTKNLDVSPTPKPSPSVLPSPPPTPTPTPTPKPVASAITSNCYSGFCLTMKEQGCNGNIPYYLLEWTTYTGPSFAYYLIMKNTVQVGGILTPASQNSWWTNADSGEVHRYYIRARKTDGGEVHSGTITLPNLCLQ